MNPWIGCTKVSPACDGCYAAELMGTAGSRFKRVDWGEPGKGEGTRDRTKDWSKPRKWNRQAAAAPGQTFVFCASLADVFDNAVPTEWRRDLFQLIHETPNLTWLLLTKRPSMIVKLFEQITEKDQTHEPLHEYWPRNAAIGCTVVTEEEADRDIPSLLLAKAALGPPFAFLSMEPLLEAVDLTKVQTLRFRGAEQLNALTGELQGMFGDPAGYTQRIDWVITGGETDQGRHEARPADPSWYRSLRDQCADAGVPFHFKQWGEWIGAQEPGMNSVPAMPRDQGFYRLRRAGKEMDPCTLDGVRHDARPEAVQ